MTRDTLIAILFGVAFIVAGALTFTGKASPIEAFGPVLAGFLGWLTRGPNDKRKDKNDGPPPAALMLLLGLFAASSAASCTPAARRDVLNTVLDIVDQACVLYNAEEGRSEEAVMTICRIDDKMAPEVRRLIAAQHKAASMRAESRDAGAE